MKQNIKIAVIALAVILMYNNPLLALLAGWIWLGYLNYEIGRVKISEDEAGRCVCYLFSPIMSTFLLVHTGPKECLRIITGKTIKFQSPFIIE